MKNQVRCKVPVFCGLCEVRHRVPHAAVTADMARPAKAIIGAQAEPGGFQCAVVPAAANVV
jgi:hypothetical protein